MKSKILTLMVAIAVIAVIPVFAFAGELNVNVSVGEHGSVNGHSENYSETVSEAGAYQIRINADEGYVIHSVLINDESVSGVLAEPVEGKQSAEIELGEVGSDVDIVVVFRAASANETDKGEGSTSLDGESTGGGVSADPADDPDGEDGGSATDPVDDPDGDDSGGSSNTADDPDGEDVGSTTSPVDDPDGEDGGGSTDPAGEDSEKNSEGSSPAGQGDDIDETNDQIDKGPSESDDPDDMNSADQKTSEEAAAEGGTSNVLNISETGKVTAGSTDQTAAGSETSKGNSAGESGNESKNAAAGSSSSGKSPETGDDAHLLSVAFVFILGGLAVTGILIRSRRAVRRRSL